jgi:hypothetical protein
MFLLSSPLQLAALEDAAGEVAEDDDGGLERELRALAAIEEAGEADFELPEDLLQSLEGYVDAAEDYVSQEDARKAALVAAVARGELSADVLAEELEEVSSSCCWGVAISSVLCCWEGLKAWAFRCAQ